MIPPLLLLTEVTIIKKFFHPQADKLYRLVAGDEAGIHTIEITITQPGLGPLLFVWVILLIENEAPPLLNPPLN